MKESELVVAKPWSDNLIIILVTFFTGVPAIWEVLRLMETQRVISIRYDKFRSLPSDVGMDTGAVVSADITTVHPEFYKKAALHFPMTLLVCPGRLGKESGTLITKLSEKSTEKVLIQIERQFVYINFASGKPVPFPQNIREGFLEHGVKCQPAFRVPVSERPKEVFDYHVRVAHSDTDLLYHTNSAMYTKYCMDCASFAQHAGFLRKLQQDVFSMNVRQLAILHRGETFPGDQLCVSVWPDEEDNSSLHFQIHKDIERVLSSTISFYLDSSHLKAKL